jgi:hypothetical protein
MFRVGKADETALTHGMTHLVEHLALYGLGASQPYAFNGLVDGIRTIFHATGSPEEVTSFLHRTCTALAALPLERTHAESQVLRTEAAGRVAGPVDALLWYRFGSTGHGLPNLREFALESPDRVAVRSWAAERFTAENAAVWFSGPIPEGVSFAGLPHGNRIPCPEPSPLPRLRTPAYLRGRSGGIAISFVTDRESWIGIPWAIAATRIQDQLRFRQGLTYAVTLVGHPLSARRLHSALVIGCLDEHAAAVREGLLEVLDSLAKGGPSPEELRQVRDRFVRAMTDIESAPSELDPACLNELIGYPVQSHESLLQQLDEMRPEHCAISVRAALESSLLMIPPECPAPGDPFTTYPRASDVKVDGRRFRNLDQKFPWSRKGRKLVVGRDGVSLVFPDDSALTVQFDASAGVVVHPNGSVLVIGLDTVNLLIKASEWHHGQEACDLIIKSAPAGLLKVIPSR